MESYLRQIAKNNYQFTTTAWDEFTIADKLGVEGIKFTFKRLFKEYKKDYKKLTDLSLVLYCKSWQWVDVSNKLSKTYGDLWEKVDVWGDRELHKEEKAYYKSLTV